MKSEVGERREVVMRRENRDKNLWSRKVLSLQVKASSRTFLSEMAVEEQDFIHMNSHTSSSIRDTPVQYTTSRRLGGILQGAGLKLLHRHHTSIYLRFPSDVLLFL